MSDGLQPLILFLSFFSCMQRSMQISPASFPTPSQIFFFKTYPAGGYPISTWIINHIAVICSVKFVCVLVRVLEQVILQSFILIVVDSKLQVTRALLHVTYALLLYYSMNTHQLNISTYYCHCPKYILAHICLWLSK